MKRRVPMMVQSQHLVSAWPAMSERERSLMGEMHLHYEREYKRLRENPNQVGLAATLLQQVDDALAHTAKVSPLQAAQVACTKGCSHCCRQHVTVTKPEALLLLHAVREEGIALDWNLVHRQAHNNLKTWHSQPLQDWGCAFLDARGACMAYNYRPVMCRKHKVIGDAAQCDTEKNPGGKVLNFVSMQAEIYSSASLTALECGTLPAMLVKHRQEAKV